MLKRFFSYAFILSIFCSCAVFCMDLEKDTRKYGFIAKQGGTIIEPILGDVNKRYSPYSTFKVLLALVAFDSGSFETPDAPNLPFKEEYEGKFQDWYTRERGQELHWCEDQTPGSFMKNSVIWVSHLITNHLGKENLQQYLARLNYGNRDISGGDLGSLFDSWLGTSLKISPREQVEFLERLLTNQLDVSKDAQEKTRIIMDREEEWGGWKLYGKTGGGREGWFVGWIEKEEHQPIVFAQHLDLDDPDLDLTDIPAQKSAGLTAKEVAKRHLLNFWQESIDK